LVSLEIDDEDAPESVNFVPLNESPALQFVQSRIDIELVIRQNLRLQSLRSILQDSAAIGFTPQTLEQQANQRTAFRQFFVLEKPRLERARACHLSTLRSGRRVDDRTMGMISPRSA